MDTEEIKLRLAELGYEVTEGDEAAILFAACRTEEKIKNACNTAEIPEGLRYKAVDMACGEFLNAKKATGQLTEYAAVGERLVKTVSEGDTTVTYQDGTAAEDISVFISGLCCAASDAEFARYRKLVW